MNIPINEYSEIRATIPIVTREGRNETKRYTQDCLQRISKDVTNKCGMTHKKWSDLTIIPKCITEEGEKPQTTLRIPFLKEGYDHFN